MGYIGKLQIAVLTLILVLQRRIKDCFAQREKGFSVKDSNVSCATIFDDLQGQGHLMLKIGPW